MNVCAGGSVTMRELIDEVGEAVGRPVLVDRQPEQPGDVKQTGGSNAAAADLLGWAPKASLHDGVAAQVEWHRSVAGA